MWDGELLSKSVAGNEFLHETKAGHMSIMKRLGIPHPADKAFNDHHGICEYKQQKESCNLHCPPQQE